MATNWSLEEVEATVVTYFEMLRLELGGEDYNKAAHRRKLLHQLRNRSEAAIERKHMNISAVLRDLGHPWIDGYKPYENYQQLLFDVIESRLKLDVRVSELVERSITDPVTLPQEVDLQTAWESPPERKRRLNVADSNPKRTRRGYYVDYFAREIKNRDVGQAGEEFVMRIEAERLHYLGQKKLAEKIDHVSKSQGDGLGYDILSYEETGQERLIEVKTTVFGKRTPFYVTRNELECSVERSTAYYLYRVFDIRRNPRLFDLQGRLDFSLQLYPTQYLGRI